MKGSEPPRIEERVFARRQRHPPEEAEQPRSTAGAAQVIG